MTSMTRLSQPDADQDWTTLRALLDGMADRTPDHVVFTYLDQGETPTAPLTYAALRDRAQGIAAFMQRRTTQGDRVMLVFPNEPDFILIALGCILAGLIIVPAAAPRNARTYAKMLNLADTAGAGLIIVSDQLAPIIAKLRQGGDSADHGPDWLLATDIPSGPATAFHPPRTDPDTIAVLQFTSGSTGNQKGVMVSHANILDNCRMLQSVCGAGPDMRMVAWLPFFHDWGLIGCMMFPLVTRGTCVFFDPSDFLRRPRRWIEAISNHRAAVTCAPNFAYQIAAGTALEAGTPLDLSCWKLAMIGAEPVRRDTIEGFAAAFAPYGFRREALFPSYGLAENTLIVTGGTPGTPPVYSGLDDGQTGEARQWVGCGAPLLNERLLIVDPDTCLTCPDGTIGEVWLSGPSVTGGYWRRPDETRAAFRATLAPTAGVNDMGQHWLRSGDLGFLADGQLFICGRLKDVIIKGGVNHLAEDLEHAMGRADPGLRPGCGAAFSIDTQGAERLVLVHEINFGKKPDLNHLIGAIQRAVSQDHGVMADAIAIMPPGSLEKTSSGKIRRQHIKGQFLADGFTPLLTWKSWS